MFLEAANVLTLCWVLLLTDSARFRMLVAAWLPGGCYSTEIQHDQDHKALGRCAQA